MDPYMIAQEYYERSCPLASYKHVTTRTCTLCTWFGGYEFHDLVDVKEARLAADSDRETYESAEAICNFKVVDTES